MTKEQFEKIQAINDAVRKELLEWAPMLTDGPGIYIWLRTDEKDISFCYVGQSKHLLTRQVQHVLGHDQPIDMGLDQYGLYDKDANPHGYRICILPCSERELDTKEEYYVYFCTKVKKWQVLNRTTGGSKGKRLFGDKVPAACEYRRGVADGRKAMAKEIAAIFGDWIWKHDGPAFRRLRELLSEGEDNINFM